MVSWETRPIMSKHLPLSVVAAFFLSWVLAGCSIARLARPPDHVVIANVEVGQGRSPNFVVFRVTVDYRLATRPEAMVGLDLALGEAGEFRTVTEHHVTRGAGTVQLMAECERSKAGKQRLLVNLFGFPRTMPVALLMSRSRTVALPH